MAERKKWLVYANRNKCHHAEALANLGFINWREGRTKMSIGDVVYLFMSDERRVRYKTEVVAEGCKREDTDYWQEPVSNHLTFKLEYREEYQGDKLDEAVLRKHGFNGGRSIELPMCNNAPLFQYIESVFDKKGYGYIIDKVILPKKSRVLAKKTIPILIRWAKQGLSYKTYNDLIKELGYSSFSGIGRQLGYIDDVFRQFEKKTGEHIPTLNALVKSKTTQLPSPGFSYVYTSYNKMSDSEKRIFVMGLNKEAIEYEHWDWVLSSLGLKPSVIETAENEESIRSGMFCGIGGEGENHKKLKEYIYNHPEAIGIHKFKMRKMEHILLSGDRIDVYFELYDGSKIAVEIKPSTSPDYDVLRGLFQCVKYKSILDAEDKIHGVRPNNSTILVMGDELSSENQKVKESLSIIAVERIKLERE